MDDQGNCANNPVNTTYTTNFIEPRESQFNSSGWLDLPSYHQCLTSLKPRFDEFVKTGDLVKIDGERYSGMVTLRTYTKQVPIGGQRSSSRVANANHTLSGSHIINSTHHLRH